MAFLNTIMGPIHPEQMGITAPHEHVIWPPPTPEDPAWLAGLPQAVEKQFNDLIDFELRGGRTVVDVSGPGLGRDLDALGLLAKSAGVHIVVSTGIGAGQSPGGDAAVLEGTFRRELTQGIGQTGVRAGIISIDADELWSPAQCEVVWTAATRAAVGTGAPVAVHGGYAEELVDRMVREGLPPERIILGHRDSVLDFTRDTMLARRGVYLAYDHVGVEAWSHTAFGQDDARRVEFLAAMIAGGLGDHLLLSCDTNCPSLMTAAPPPHSLGYLLRCFVPRLQQAGVPAEAVQQLLVENPKRVLPTA